MDDVLSAWTQELGPRASLRLIDKMASHHARLGGLVGLVIDALIKERNYIGLLDFEIDYNFTDWDETQLYNCRQALALYTKLEWLDVGLDQEAAAFAKFEEAEGWCRDTNEVFRLWRRGAFEFSPDDNAAFRHARLFISKVLGPCPAIADLPLSFGPGSTTTIKKSEACPQNKLADMPTCSMNLLASGLLPSLMRELPHWLECHAAPLVPYDWDHAVNVAVNVGMEKLKFAAKNAKVKRTIGQVPTLNTLLQKGIGTYMFRRLMRFGLDLEHGDAINRAAAEFGSRTGNYCTIDLVSASGSIATNAVQYFVRPDWFTLMSAARVGSVQYKDRVITYEQFSSMGNGFTFPLESLLFWALARAAVWQLGGDPETVNVFGDDIVCPTLYYGRVTDLLSKVGFHVNGKKSFSTGRFRESCGADYYSGINIRPFYQKDLVSCRTLFIMHNFYYRRNLRMEADMVKAFIPTHLRLYGPDGYGDGHLISEHFHVQRPCKRDLDAGYEGAYFSTFVLKDRKVISRYPGDWVSPLYSVYVSDRSEDLPGICITLGQEFLKDGRVVWPLPGVEQAKKGDITFDAYEKKLIYSFGLS